MRKITCGIYKITSPSGKVYIGQSIFIEKRFWHYSKNYCREQRKLYCSFLSHGVDKHVFEIIHRCERSELNKWEIHYMDVFDSMGIKGLNIRAGGNEGIQSEETKEKLRKASMGNKNAAGKRTPEMRLRMSVAQRNKAKPTAQACRNISKALRASAKFKRTMNSRAYREKMRRLRTGYVPTEATINKLKAAWVKRKLRCKTKK